MGQKNWWGHQTSRWGNLGARKPLWEIEERYSDSPKWEIVCCTASEWVRWQGADNTYWGGCAGTTFPAVVGTCPSLLIWWGGQEWGSRDLCRGWPRESILQYCIPYNPYYSERSKVIYCLDRGWPATSNPDSWKWGQSLLGRKWCTQCPDCGKH
jgi:hypothetical protein